MIMIKITSMIMNLALVAKALNEDFRQFGNLKYYLRL